MDRLSEEEKKAIDYYINNEYSFGFETDMDMENFKKAIGIEETDENTWEKHQIRFKALVNLIKKQQKEIKELKWKESEQKNLLKHKTDKIDKQQKEIEELEEDNAELRRLKNKLSIATAIALGGRKIPISKKTLNELNDMFSIEIEYRPFYDDYVFYAK